MKKFCYAWLLCLVTLPFTGKSHGQVPLMFDQQVFSSEKLVVLVQGERRKLNNDFVAQLEGDKLRIALDTRGMLNASPDDALLVSLIQPSGEKQEMRPDENGELVFEKVSQGLAALVVTADSLANTSVSSLYAAIPFYVTPQQAGPAPEPFKVPVADVEPSRLAQALNDNVEAQSNDSEIMEPGEFDLVTASSFRVRRLADGSVQGQVVVPQRGYLAIPGITQISFRHDGQFVASTSTNAEGYFVAENVPVGVNSIVATGSSGHAAYSLEIVDFQGQDLPEPIDPLTDNDARKRTKLVSLPQQVGNSALVFLIPPSLMPEVRETLDDRIPAPVVNNAAPPIANAPIGPAPTPGFAGTPGGGFGGGGGGFGGGGGGFGGGGGGFGGGGGGIGALAGLAGLGVGISAIADDDDGFNQNQSTGITAP